MCLSDIIAYINFDEDNVVTTLSQCHCASWVDFSCSQIKFVDEFTKNDNFFSSKQKLLLCCIIPVFCFPFSLYGFCTSFNTLKYLWILNKNVFRIFFFLNLGDFSKHTVLNGLILEM